MSQAAILPVRLSVQQIDFQCLFDMTWGEGQKLSATIPFPRKLEAQYHLWLKAYDAFYTALPLASDPGDIKPGDIEPGDIEPGDIEPGDIEPGDIEPGDTLSPLRGRLEHQGQLQPNPIDWQAALVQAEAELFYQFHQWLRHQNLFEIRSQLALLARAVEGRSPNAAIDIFLSATPILLAKFPWEHWELGAEFGAQVPFRVARCPTQLRSSATALFPVQRKKLRVLAILGDERGLDFQGDRDALKSITPYAEIQFVGWQPRIKIQTLKRDICNALEDPRGWDLLFFAGHSHEKSVTGGEFLIAPNQVLSLQQLLPYLKEAHKNGLQLSVFNSCNGLGIAERLLELGLGQVAIMREPIHNQVAHAFLQRFLAHLANGKDAQDAIHLACQNLALSQGVTYPSAYCLPSLFRHPTTQPFCFKPMRLGDRLRRLAPTKWEAIALSILLISSLLPLVQTKLLESRLWFQAVYREITSQVPPVKPVPDVVTIQIDEASLVERGMTEPNPMDRAYLAEIIDQLRVAGASVIGIDYLLDQPGTNSDSQTLRQSVQTSVQQNKSWFVFSSVATLEAFEKKVHPTVALPGWSLSGDASILLGYVRQPNSLQDCIQHCPMGYLLALLGSALKDSPQSFQDVPNLSDQTNLQETVLQIIAKQHTSPSFKIFRNYRRSNLTRLSQNVGQLWFMPILDFSIPSPAIYSAISAKDFLASRNESLPPLTHAIVLVGSGGYSDAEDNFTLPIAQRFWQELGSFPQPLERDRNILSGVEIHGFMVHHFLNRRLVVPIPDVLMVLTVAVIMKLYQPKVLTSAVSKRRPTAAIAGLIGLLISGGLCLQLFISVAILVPWLFPSLTMILYGVPMVWGKGDVPKR